MIRAFFSTFTCYGFWLPNDPRGSGSSYVGSKALLPFGTATKVSTRHSVARRWCDPVIRREAKDALKYPPVLLNGLQARSVASAFAEVIAKAGCITYACAILPDHVHVVVSRPPYSIEQLITRLKGGATTRLRRDGIHPFQNDPMPCDRLPKMWGRGKWNVFLDNDDDVLNRIDYVEKNPTRQGLRPQHWSFIERYVPSG
jgi:REP element-mobilizing transposase RayT